MIVCDPGDPVAASEPVRWAIGELEAALGGAPVPTVVAGGAGGPAVREALARAGLGAPEGPESVVLARAGDAVVATGGGVRGVVYALLDLADRVRCAPDLATAFRLDPPVVARPGLAVRSVARLFTSRVEDLAWWHDRGFWERYLTELATHRLNRFALTLGLGYNFPRGVTDAYLHFPYPFLLDVPGYAARVPGLPDAERERNLATLRFIGEAVRRRGLHFQLGLWTHAYAWVDSPHPSHTVAGLTAANHAAYCRDALHQLLAAVPAVDGLTFRIHGESGIPEGSHDFWRTVFDGVVRAARGLGKPLEIDMHAKGMDGETIAAALQTGLPVVVSPKYIGEHQGLPYHQAAIREIERTARPRAGHMAVSGGARRHTRYGYTDLLEEDRAYDLLFRIWPGTQRLLLWGDPVLAAGFGRQAGFAGARGVELCEPLTFKGRMGSGQPGGRHGYAEPALFPGDGGASADWEKYRYTYRVWGRCTYSPDAEPDGWRRWLRREFGAAAPDAEAALACASRVLLLLTTAHGPSANCKTYWPELYTNMPIASAEGHPYDDTRRPRTFGNASPLDPALFSGVDEFAEEVLAAAPSGRYSPLDVARWLEDLAAAAERHLAAAEAKIGGHRGTEFRRWVADAGIQAALGRFFGHKLRAGVAYALFEGTADPAALRAAVAEYETARDAWRDAAECGRVYRRDLTFGPQPWQRGHWADRLPSIEADLAALRARLPEAAGGAATPRRRAAPALEAIPLTAPADPEAGLDHAPPPLFEPGQAVRIEVTAPRASGSAGAVSLRYRHANQAEAYQTLEMHPLPLPAGAGSARPGVRFGATIPAADTASPYPLVYFFVVRDAAGRARLHPGLDGTLANQPYYLLRQVGATHP